MPSSRVFDALEARMAALETALAEAVAPALLQAAADLVRGSNEVEELMQRLAPPKEFLHATVIV
jgi:hypothetical protein